MKISRIRIVLRTVSLAIAIVLCAGVSAVAEDGTHGRLPLQLRIAEAKRKTDTLGYYRSVARQKKIRTGQRTERFTPPAFSQRGRRLSSDSSRGAR